MKLRNIIYSICLFISVTAFAQNDARISQHWQSRINYNPASCGASNYGNITLVGRHQFLGFKGAPTTALLNFDILAGTINSGFGLNVTYDVYGPIISYDALINYAYHIKTGEYQYLSLGLALGAQFRQYDPSGNIYEQVTEETKYDKESYICPAANFGLEYNLKGWQIGLSITNLQRYFLEKSILFQDPNYYLYTRYKFEVSRSWDVIPAVALRTDFVTLNSEINLTIQYTKAFWFGCTFRMAGKKPEAVVPTVGFNITDFVRIGYAYDYYFGDLNKYNTGSHELLLTFRFRTQSRTNKTPRFVNW